jgi:hypothetical protein
MVGWPLDWKGLEGTRGLVAVSISTFVWEGLGEIAKTLSYDD